MTLKTTLTFPQQPVSGLFALTHVVAPGVAGMTLAMSLATASYEASGASIAWEVAYSPDGIQPYVVDATGRWDSTGGPVTSPKDGTTNPQPTFAFGIDPGRVGQTLRVRLSIPQIIVAGAVAKVQ